MSAGDTRKSVMSKRVIRSQKRDNISTPVTNPPNLSETNPTNLAIDGYRATT